MAKDDKALIQEKVSELITLIMDVEDPDVLNDYRKKFKKYVPWIRRSWVSAYFFKEYITKGKSSTNRSGRQAKNSKRGGRNEQRQVQNDKKERASRKENAEKTGRDSFVPEEGDWMTVYFGIGKSKRIYRQTLIDLIIETTGIAPSDIGGVKNLSHFSFVVIEKSKANHVIEKMNGMEVKGRPIKVNEGKS